MKLLLVRVQVSLHSCIVNSHVENIKVQLEINCKHTRGATKMYMMSAIESDYSALNETLIKINFHFFFTENQHNRKTKIHQRKWRENWI